MACLARSGSRAFSCWAPLRCTKATVLGILPPSSANRPAKGNSASSGTARNRIALGSDARLRTSPGRPRRAGVSSAGCPAALTAGASVRPRLPRPATNSGSGAGVLRGGGAGGCFGRLEGEELVQLFAIEGFDDLQLFDHHVHLVALLGEDRRRGLVAMVDDAADLLVDDGRDLFGIVPLLAEVATEEDELFAVTHRHVADLVRHPPLGHHPARHLRRPLDVVLGPGRDVAEDDLLRDPAAHDPGD